MAAAYELMVWLLDEGRCFRKVEPLLEALLPCVRAHAPVDRFWAGTTVLHPQAAAYGWVWTPENTRSIEFSHERFASLQDLDTPLRRLRRGAPFVRFRRDGGADGLPDVQALFDSGHTDYYARGMHFRGAWAGGFTWCTRAPDGFSDDHIALFDGVHSALAAVLEPMAVDSMYATLLRTYLGRDAGDRVVSGQVRRGDGQDMRAAIWFSDVRGFTALSASTSRDALLEALDHVFKEVVDAVQAEGGQVLKFMGDGALAIFSCADDPDGRQACAAAARAADRLQERLDDPALNPRGTRVGVGLHYGDLTYGNIGAPSRLDFTVIGPSVNLAARVEGLCGKTGASVLATRAFTAGLEGWQPVGSFDLKGVPEGVEVLALDRQASASSR